MIKTMATMLEKNKLWNSYDYLLNLQKRSPVFIVDFQDANNFQNIVYCCLQHFTFDNYSFPNHKKNKGIL